MLERFKIADTDGDGVMTFDEFQSFTSSLGHINLGPKRLKAIFKEMVEDSVGLGAEDVHILRWEQSAWQQSSSAHDRALTSAK
jgi:hypothetical protein